MDVADEPVAHGLIGAASVPALDLSWRQAFDIIAGTETYLVATVRPDMAPHVVPVLGVWVDGVLHFNSASRARKARNLGENPHVSVSAPGTDYDFVIDGRVEQVTDAAAGAGGGRLSAEISVVAPAGPRRCVRRRRCRRHSPVGCLTLRPHTDTSPEWAD